MQNLFRSLKQQLVLIVLTFSFTLFLSSCYDYNYHYYSTDGVNWITRCDFRDSTFFLPGRKSDLSKESGYISIKNRDFRAGWKCIITWHKDTAYLLEKYYDFNIINKPSMIHLIHIDAKKFNDICESNDKSYLIIKNY